MPRRLRIATGGILFHVLNRAAGRTRIFTRNADYLAFERVIAEVHARLNTRLLDYVLMPNHFHLALWPRDDGELSEYMRLLTVTHTQRWHAHHHSAGTGPLYQGRFKSFPIEQDEHALTVCRYIERNPVRARLVTRAERWRWSGAFKRLNEPDVPWLLPIERWPVDVPRNWQAFVNRPQNVAEEAWLRTCIKRGRPFGSERWQRLTARRLGLESALRPRGRPQVRPLEAAKGR